MDKKLFDRLALSLQQMDVIVRGIRKPSRRFEVNPTSIKGLRARTRLSQARFAELLSVDLATLRNWEQGRREPTGPARALLRAIEKDPVNVLKALAS